MGNLRVLPRRNQPVPAGAERAPRVLLQQRVDHVVVEPTPSAQLTADRVAGSVLDETWSVPMRCFATKRALPRAKLLATTAIGVALTAAAIAQGRLEFEVAAIRPVAGDVLPRLGYDLRGISNGRLLIRALPARE